MYISEKSQWMSGITLFAICIALCLLVDGAYIRVASSWIISASANIPAIQIHYTLTMMLFIITSIALLCTIWCLEELGYRPFFIVLAAMALGLLDAFIGKWMLHANLPYAAVVAHLLIGQLTLGLFWWLYSYIDPRLIPSFLPAVHKAKIWAWMALFFILIETMLGGLVSANYADAACASYPYCQNLSFFDLPWRQLWHALSFPMITTPNLQAAIHYLHRLGAYALIAYIFLFSCFFLLNRYLYDFALKMLLIIVAQSAIGFYGEKYLHSAGVVIIHHVLSSILLLFAISLLVNLYAKPQKHIK